MRGSGSSDGAKPRKRRPVRGPSCSDASWVTSMRSVAADPSSGSTSSEAGWQAVNTATSAAMWAGEYSARMIPSGFCSP